MLSRSLKAIPRHRYQKSLIFINKRYSSTFATAIETAEKLVQPKTSASSPLDPFAMVSAEMATLGKHISQLIGSGHPVLNRVASYYFEAEGKNVRPLIVLLLSKALSKIPINERNRIIIDQYDVNTQKEFKGTPKAFSFAGADPLKSISPLNILHGINPNIILNPLSRPMIDQDEKSIQLDIKNGILPKQRRLAEITEMIHTASLLHDDVIDFSDSRRGRESGNIAFSNKMAILAGDFLLGRASVSLGRLRNSEVVELMSTAIANLVEGEFMQLKNTVINPDLTTINNDGQLKKIPLPTGKVPVKVHEYSINGTSNIISHNDNVEAAFQYYLHKTYLKTASLMSKSSRSTAILAGCNEELIENCYQFGRNLGLCFQIVDDMLDYTTTAELLGKPAGADLKLGLATAPVLFAWKDKPELAPLIARKFSQNGDVEIAKIAVDETNGVQKTLELAIKYRDDALNNLRVLPESSARSALELLTNSIITRNK
ncbi:trans-hexaprenyltranstransferase [Pichia kluyveri]|uniref:Trans-hexaprenyltranstransferase n=1 Tax=Pichia kluyveri TaxID=36015 RepID=A0AAV5RCX1_PICKL|nr:trans-hexaprenyltranstransferase [Pichia kluyveri]